MKVWQIVGDGGIDTLEMAERPSPEPGPGQVRVRVRANSINYRDLNTVRAPGRMGLAFPRIPNSDGAGDVAMVGAGVSGIAVGDRVAGCFFQNWAAGGISAAAMASAQGGPIDGMLAEEVVLNAHGVVPIPAQLDHAEAATLPCAALTAWSGLTVKGNLKAGDTVLLLGTGGVSIFALQFCTLMGARAIVTSKSDDKLARARAMGAWQTINYTETPDWATREGHDRRRRRRPCRRSRRRRDAGAVHRGGADRRPYRHDRRADPGRGEPDADPAQVDPP